MQIPFIDDAFIERHTCFKSLTEQLRESFANSQAIVPDRHHHDFPNAPGHPPSTLLLMPAWCPGQTAGVKIVTVSPENARHDLPSVQGVYLLLDANTGGVSCILAAQALTAKRTAATSALASSYLSREDATSMLMIGTGALSENLIRAHASVRDLETIFVWGRNPSKAQIIAQRFDNEALNVVPVDSIDPVISQVDIISSATLSTVPLVFGEALRPGQHVDLVGSFRPDMRESDDQVIQRGSVFLDTMTAGLRESGDIAIPLRNQVLSPDEIKGDLNSLCSLTTPGRSNNDEITVFKSVGYALEDLVAANYYHDQWNHEH